MSIDPHKRLAITLWPEFAWAVAYLGKDIENRGWAPQRLIGEWLCIHGGKSIGGKPMPRRCGVYPGPYWVQCLDAVSEVADFAGCTSSHRGRLGNETVLREGRGIVAVCKIAGFVYGEAKGWFVGAPQIGWKLSQVVTLPQPVECKGAQGLWSVPPETLVQVRYQLERARQGLLEPHQRASNG